MYDVLYFFSRFFCCFFYFFFLLSHIKGQMLLLLFWTSDLLSILAEDLDLFVASSISHQQLVRELILDYCGNLTFFAYCASAGLANKGEVCSARLFGDSLFDHIINDDASRRLRCHLAWDLSDVWRVGKPKKCDLCIADRCHQWALYDIQMLRW